MPGPPRTPTARSGWITAKIAAQVLGVMIETGRDPVDIIDEGDLWGIGPRPRRSGDLPENGDHARPT